MPRFYKISPTIYLFRVILFLFKNSSLNQLVSRTELHDYANFLINRPLAGSREISIIHQDFLIEAPFMHEPHEINTISDMLLLLPRPCGEEI